LAFPKRINLTFSTAFIGLRNRERMMPTAAALGWQSLKRLREHMEA
jgi:hypothetical protein